MTRPLSVAYKEKVGDVSIQGTVFTSVPSRVSPRSLDYFALRYRVRSVHSVTYVSGMDP